MKINVLLQPSSVYALDDDWSEGNFEEGLHLAIRCVHDLIYFDRDLQTMFCPDCHNKHLTRRQEEAYLEINEDNEYTEA